MAANPPTTRDNPNRRARIITTILMIMIAVMIVRDIFVRRWGTATPPAADVTERSR
jgi:hypothetical protein